MNKRKHFFKHVLNVSDFFNIYRYDDKYTIDENIFNLCIDVDSWVYEHGAINLDDYREDAYNYLREQCPGIPVDNYADDIDDMIKQSLGNAYRDSYESNLIDYIYDAIESKLNGLDFVKWYWSRHGEPVEYKYEANDVTITCTRKQYRAFIEPEIGNGYTIAELMDDHDLMINYIQDEIGKPDDLQDYDRYGTTGDFDNWLTFFKDYEEISSQYKKDELTHNLKSRFRLVA